jgi:hypothetical protein
MADHDLGQIRPRAGRAVACHVHHAAVVATDEIGQGAGEIAGPGGPAALVVNHP